MPIKYYLQPNPITPDPNDQSARVLPNASLSLNDIISKMMKRGTTVTEADARAVLNLFLKSCAMNSWKAILSIYH
jgi:hypothetical protein